MDVLLLLIYTVLLSLVISVLYKLLTDQNAMKNIKEEMNQLKKKADEAKKDGDMAKMNKYTGEMLKVSSQQFKHTMKPMFVSMFVFIIAVGWFGAIFANLVVETPFAGIELSWILWYIIITLPATTVFRKLMGAM